MTVPFCSMVLAVCTYVCDGMMCPPPMGTFRLNVTTQGCYSGHPVHAPIVSDIEWRCKLTVHNLESSPPEAVPQKNVSPTGQLAHQLCRSRLPLPDHDTVLK